ncbi:MAG TPA: hypothetical protein VMS00_03415 [Acidimicrobiales bacterium]|nr:hypothetical protein [Acidimicrobiales bacterium]
MDHIQNAPLEPDRYFGLGRQEEQGVGRRFEVSQVSRAVRTGADMLQ